MFFQDFFFFSGVFCHISSYINVWLAQYFHSRFYKVSVKGANIISSGEMFQWFTTLMAMRSSSIQFVFFVGIASLYNPVPLFFVSYPSIV